MHYAKLLLSLGVVALTTFTGCVDDDYDLSDIDTTVQVQVNDLTLPINFDPIQLKSVLKPSENSCFKELDGEYAVLQSGKIKSDPISIATQHIQAPTVTPTVRDIYVEDNIPSIPSDVEIEEKFTYSITDFMGDFNYTKNDIPAEIVAIRSVEVDWNISINVSISDASAKMRNLDFEDVIITLPVGLTTTDKRYNPATGELNLGNVELPAGTTTYKFSVPVTAVDFSKWSSSDFSFTPGVNGGKGTIKVAGHVGVKSGKAIVSVLISVDRPESVVMTMAPTLSDIHISSFSGRVQYSFSNFNIDNINISDLPKLLNDSQTSIILANPQIYMSVNNPMANYGLDATANLQLTPLRHGVSGKPVELNPGQSINIGHDRGIDGPYQFCISPSKPDRYYEGYANATQVYCSDFADILVGDGIPNAIAVKVPDAGLVPGDVENFRLGESLGEIEGKYTVYCPLQLGEGSKLVYSDDVDGWNDDTVDRIVITDLALTTTIENTLPFEVELSGYPLSVGHSGEAVQSVDPATGKPVELQSITVRANSATTITTHTTGTVVHLDGIHFVARAIVDEPDTSVISPDQTITLKDVRVTVSGSYTDKL